MARFDTHCQVLKNVSNQRLKDSNLIVNDKNIVIYKSPDKIREKEDNITIKIFKKQNTIDNINMKSSLDKDISKTNKSPKILHKQNTIIDSFEKHPVIQETKIQAG